MKIRALIADDEPLARERVRELLAGENDIEVLAECSDGREAVEAIEKHTPDLVFLDIEMPELDGFQVLKSVRAEHMPAVIFITAYDRYAIKAFEEHAVDYLLKPFDRNRFMGALNRARNRMDQGNNGSLSTRLAALLQQVDSQPKLIDRLAIKSRGRVVFLRTDEIEWIEAAGNYVEVHSGKDCHLIRDTLNNFEEKLDARKFMRIHRSCMVNLEFIKELQPGIAGEYVVLMRDGRQLTLSRGYRDKVQQLIGGSI
jgi:two-component system, LytTR family, response regulator